MKDMEHFLDWLDVRKRMIRLINHNQEKTFTFLTMMSYLLGLQCESSGFILLLYMFKNIN